MQRKPKFKTELVTAVDSFVTSALEGGPFPVAAYSRFRADHPVVKAVPDFFIEDGADYAEIAAQRTRLMMASSPPPDRSCLNPGAPNLRRGRASQRLQWRASRQGRTGGEAEARLVRARRAGGSQPA